MNNTSSTRDEQLIVEHIHGIFRSFIRHDRDALLEAHSEDWTGFLGPSSGIERGREAYLKNAEISLQNFRGRGYELLDLETRLFGDIAHVFYVARYDYDAAGGQAGSIPLRSVDLYQRRAGEWIQIGSHISVIPATGVWGLDRGHC
jgi:ketosteroid isomerase-like protein